MSTPVLGSVATAAALIRDGGVVAYPTEAVYGLGCDPGNSAAVQRILTLKKRAAGKGLILVASHWHQLERFIAPLKGHERERAEASWPGPVTWIMPAGAGVSELISGGRSTVAVRISAHPVVSALCTAAGHALVSTSANTSGDTPLMNASAIHQRFGDGIDAIVAGSLGGLGSATPIFDIITGERLR